MARKFSLALYTLNRPRPVASVEFVTGRTGPRKTRAPGPCPRPAPLNGLGRGVFFGIPCPCPRSGLRPTHTPDGSPLIIAGNKQGPVQGTSAGGPQAGAGRGLPEKYPPRPRVRAGPGECKLAPPRPLTNTMQVCALLRLRFSIHERMFVSSISFDSI